MIYKKLVQGGVAMRRQVGSGKEGSAMRRNGLHRVVRFAGIRSLVTLLLAAHSVIAAGGVASADSAWKLVLPQDVTQKTGPALMQVADLGRSDPEIAGLMFRCAAHAIDTIVVLVEPLPPRSHVSVTLEAGRDVRTFDAEPIPTGAGLRLPFDPRDAVAIQWKGAADLKITAALAAGPSHATVSLTGLAGSLTGLDRQCEASAVASPQR